MPPWEDQSEGHRIARMTGPDCAIMCNLINTHTHTYSTYWLTRVKIEKICQRIPPPLYIYIYPYIYNFFFSERAARAGGGGRCQTFLFFFPCSADHEREWPPCKVVFFGLATNALNVGNNNNTLLVGIKSKGSNITINGRSFLFKR